MVSTWNRPLPPAVPQRASGAVVSISSNLFPVIRENGLMLFSSFPNWEGNEESLSWKEKAEKLKFPDMSGWILDETGSVVYSTASILGAQQGPRIECDLIDSARLWTLMLRKWSTASVGPFRLVIPSTDEWVEVRVVSSQGTKSRTAIAVSSVAPRHDLKTLLDVYHLSEGRWPVRVKCSHYKERFYRITHLHSLNATETRFTIKGEEMTVEDYYKRVRKIQLERPDLPLAVDAQGRFLPLELCFLVDPWVSREPRPISMEAVLSHPVFAELAMFGFTVGSTAPIQTRGRQLPPSVRRSDDPLSVNQGKVSVVVVSFSAEEETINFLDQLKSEAAALKFGTIDIIKIHQLQLTTEWERDIKEQVLHALKEKPDMFLVLMNERLPDSVYRRLKIVLDLRIQIVSQFALVGNHASRPPRYWSTILDHVSLKVGPAVAGVKGSGTVIGGISTMSLPEWKSKLVACTMSFDNGMRAFLNRVEAKPKNSDFNFGQIFYEILLSYYSASSFCFPNRIIMFVSQPEASIGFRCIAGLLGGAHSAVSRINRELRTGINNKLRTSSSPISPNWTFIFSDRRSGIQIQTESRQAVVTSTGIVSAYGIQFLLWPGESGSKPVKFAVVHDTNNFSLPEIENFTHQICLGSVPLPLVHAEKLLVRVRDYVIHDRKLYMQSDATDACEIMNQRLFDYDQEVFRYRAPYM